MSKNVLLSVLAIVLIFFGTPIFAMQNEDVLRFHVLANSDTVQDQLIKENVRNAVLEYIQPQLALATSVAQSKEILSENLTEIQSIAEQIVRNWGKDYKIEIVIETTTFPTKSYGDIVFPAGEYEACRILIGEALGENWWCVLYPSLCYVDEATGIVYLEGSDLNEEQYSIIEPYLLKFKLFEWLFK